MRFSVIVVAASLVSSSAFGQWVYQKQESAFGDNTTHFALTAKDSYIFGLRCGSDEMLTLFVTPESLTPDDAEKFSVVPMLLLIRVDSNDVFSLEATPESIEGKMRLSANSEHELTRQIQDARKRVAVAVSIAGKRFHEVSFNVRGSTDAAKKLLAACAVDD